MLCGFLDMPIYVYTPSWLVNKDGELSCGIPMHFGENCEREIFLWHHEEHSELILKFTSL
jgi:hypothetical protein